MLRILVSQTRKLYWKIASPWLVEFLEGLKFDIGILMKRPPIVIYQMGKVGSSTVYASLRRASLPNHIYHVHFLTRSGIEHIEMKYRRAQVLNPFGHLTYSKMLLRRLNMNRRAKGIRWKIITLTREPIGTLLSHIFHNPEIHRPDLLDEHGKVKNSEVMKYAQDQLSKFDASTDYISTWFDREFRASLNLDIYDYPFNHEEGFIVIGHDKFDLLVLRLEDLDNTFEKAVNRFLEKNFPMPILKSNINIGKKHSTTYKSVLENILIPESVCRKIYSTKYARHFYSESMINRLIQKWSRRRP